MKLNRMAIVAAGAVAVLAVGGGAAAFVLNHTVDVDGDEKYVQEQAAVEQSTGVDKDVATNGANALGVEQYRGGGRVGGGVHVGGGARGGFGHVGEGRAWGGHPGWGYGRPGYESAVGGVAGAAVGG